MAFIPLPGGIKICYRFTKAGQNCCNVFHATTDVPVDEALLESIGNEAKQAWVDTLAGYTSGDVSLQAIEIQDISTPGGIGIEYTTGLPLTGTPGLTASPNNVTVATKLTTGRTGRSQRGRFYFVGLSPTYTETDKQHILPVMQAQLALFVDALIDNLASAAVELVVASFFSGGAPRTEGVATPVLGGSANLTLDSQRRRLPERGS